MIHVTDKAAEQIRTIMQKENLVDHGLRVAVIGGGCSGMSYKLAFEKEPVQDDKVYEEKGVRIFVDGKSYLVLNGTTLDFSDGLSGTGFSFTNPNAKSTCGCGTSFSS
jgi:iron-sulfur cluster assembly accessory protein